MATRLQKINRTHVTILIVAFVVFLPILVKGNLLRFFKQEKVIQVATTTPYVRDTSHDVLYQGTIYHIFFHSLIIYPKLAYEGDSKSASYEEYMITRDQFLKILPELYKNNFVLIDLASIYTVEADGKVAPRPLYLPPGKKPLVISLDDLNYYPSLIGRGFARKLVIDKNGEVATEVVTPENSVVVTRDGDVVPILDDFVKVHPDFSLNGAKGVIAETGYQGALGYRTEGYNTTPSEREKAIAAVKPVIEKLKNTGWKFASHSYTHQAPFKDATIPLATVIRDTDQWKREMEPLLGKTDIYVGPFGQIFTPGDPRQDYLLSQGFKILCGVGMDLYLHYFPDHVVMDRADIDGYRLTHDPRRLDPYFNVESVK